jgi:hypothetical protein
MFSDGRTGYKPEESEVQVERDTELWQGLCIALWGSRTSEDVPGEFKLSVEQRMNPECKLDPRSQHFGLPESLLVPIAARDVASIQGYVGCIHECIHGRSGRVNALSVIPYVKPEDLAPSAPLWSHPDAERFKRSLHPVKQIWVHVDYDGYRKAYERLDMSKIPPDHVLDHIQNREAVRLRGYSHPYIRLCPVHWGVNTSAGHDTGGEGMEKEYLRSLDQQPESVQVAVEVAMQCDIIYADPMDLTKMLNIAPGTFVLDGVRDMLRLFYPE